MIDSHCHLDHEPLIDNLSDIIKRSKEIGIKKLLTISTSLNSFNNINKILPIDNIIYGTFGIHPHETNNIEITKNTIIENVNKNSRIIGVGETGLDFYYNNSKKNKQIYSFKQHIEAAIETNKPLIVHSRNAEKETFNILNEYKHQKPKILMHCFTGSYNFYKKMEELDSFFSAIISSAEAFGRLAKMSTDTRMYHCLPMFYNAGILNTVLAPMMVGGQVIVGEMFSQFSAFNFWRPILSTNANIMVITPTMTA